MKPINNSENYGKCVCVNCPLYGDCNKEKAEKLFCARHKSGCSMDNTKMCICGTCPVFAENKLTGGYFCINEI
jgi:hypothetical protein